MNGKIAPKSNVVEVADLVAQGGRQNLVMHYGKPIKMLPGFVPLACHQRTSCEKGRARVQAELVGSDKLQSEEDLMIRWQSDWLIVL